MNKFEELPKEMREHIQAGAEMAAAQAELVVMQYDDPTEGWKQAFKTLYKTVHTKNFFNTKDLVTEREQWRATALRLQSNG